MEPVRVTPETLGRQEDDEAFNEGLYLALARHRRRTGEKQYTIAARVGVSPAELSRWIYEERRPSPEQVVALLELLGGRHEELFPDVGHSHAGSSG